MTNDTSTMDIAASDTLLQRLQDFPDTLAAFVSSFPRAAIRQRPPQGGFSLVEHLCHLRDLEREGFRLRIRRILTQDMPELQEIDGSTLAIERDYASQDADAALRDWRAARTQTVLMLREALPAQAARKGIYGGFGVVTLASLAQGIVVHDSSHWGELQALFTSVSSGG
jgi:hypothetical protein